jgi:hypothetical protein
MDVPQIHSGMFLLRSGEIEAIEVHHLVPRRDKVLQKLLLGDNPITICQEKN